MSDLADLSDLGSVAQSARLKQLHTARGILLFVGILTVVMNFGDLMAIESTVDAAIKKEVDGLRARGLVADQSQVAKSRADVIRLAMLIDGTAIGLGVLFIVFGLMLKQFPVPITILSLVLYVGATAVFGLLVPMTLFPGIIFKLIVIVALAKSIQAALAYEREKQSVNTLDALPT
jgi:hypothetical protein